MNLKISSRAPTRIDLAGGTLDIWPLFLFLTEPMTINLGINLFAEATLVESTPASHDKSPGHVTLKSLDQNLEIQLPWHAIADGEVPHIPSGLELHYRLLRYFLDKRRILRPLDSTQSSAKGLHGNLLFSTTAQSPAGAGLGGSSALSIAMIGALSTWISAKQKGPTDAFDNFNSPDTTQDGQAFIDVVRDVETTVIRVPAGLQDYYGAMYGGLQCLQWGIGGHQREYLPPELIQELQERILLFYSGKSRNSGINNWTLFKDFIDNKNEVRSKFERISAATHALKKALLQRNWDEVGQAITQEWEVRKTLGTGITTPEIETAFTQAGKLAQVSGKICGAGGGGCFFLYLPIDDRAKRVALKSKLETLFAQQELQRLEFQGVPRGLEVTVHREE